jgi:hypothetical protein
LAVIYLSTCSGAKEDAPKLPYKASALGCAITGTTLFTAGGMIDYSTTSNQAQVIDLRYSRKFQHSNSTGGTKNTGPFIVSGIAMFYL